MCVWIYMDWCWNALTRKWLVTKKNVLTWKMLLLFLILNVFKLRVFWYEKLKAGNLFHRKGVYYRFKLNVLKHSNRKKHSSFWNFRVALLWWQSKIFLMLTKMVLWHSPVTRTLEWKQEDLKLPASLDFINETLSQIKKMTCWIWGRVVT